MNRHSSNMPALLTITLCCLAQALRFTPLRALELRVGQFETEMVFNLGVIASLPFAGALGAFLARRSGASRFAALRAVVSPVALVSAVLLTMLVWDLVQSRALVSSLAYSCGILLGWVLIPCIALLAGGAIGWSLSAQKVIEQHAN